MSDGDASYRVVTDPSEGPKQFTIQTRVTSRGETAVILMGVDCAERVMCHESAPFDLEEGHFVFKLGPGTAGILDQLLAQGALRVARRRPRRPTGTRLRPHPGRRPQPASRRRRRRRQQGAPRRRSDAADASGNAFFDRLRAEDAQAASPARTSSDAANNRRAAADDRSRDAADAGATSSPCSRAAPAALRRRR